MRIAILILIIVLTSCDNNKSHDNNLKEREKQEQVKFVKEFSLSYFPDSIPNNGISSLANIPDSTKLAFETVEQINKSEQEKYLTLIFLKLYRSHLQCCNQAYVIRDRYTKEKLVNVFERITDLEFRKNNFSEYVLSNIGYLWVKKNSYLINYKPIEVEISTIEKNLKRIENSDM